MEKEMQKPHCRAEQQQQRWHAGAGNTEGRDTQGDNRILRHSKDSRPGGKGRGSISDLMWREALARANRGGGTNPLEHPVNEATCQHQAP